MFKHLNDTQNIIGCHGDHIKTKKIVGSIWTAKYIILLIKFSKLYAKTCISITITYFKGKLVNHNNV